MAYKEELPPYMLLYSKPYASSLTINPAADLSRSKFAEIHFSFI
jgi:hypothetical protein